MRFSRTVYQVHEKWLYTVTVMFAFVLFNSAFCEVRVKIAKGILKGRILKSRGGRPYYSFTSVPYAKPPVGELRFEAPEPVDPWNGTLDATGTANACVQKSEMYGNEDCLYLNVYTPNVTDDQKFPVMFWIHGGGFSMGHGSPEMFGPDYFMDKNVVLISINYRLGVLGLLSAEDEVIPGNYGMKDQVMALRWVSENVANFGGDSGRVTIFGGSSGAVNVGYHMLSPMSKGLFHKAILQSGTPSCLWSTSLPGVSRERSKIVAKLAGCARNTSRDVLQCLKTIPAGFFADVHEKLWEWRTFPTILFSPVVERCDSGRQAFLCHHQLYDFRQESFVPAIIGLNSAEGALYNDTSLLYPEFRTNFNHLMSIIMAYRNFTLNLNEIGRRIFEKYYPSGRMEDDSHFQTLQMITDGSYLHGILGTAFKLSSPVYFYLYNYQNEYSFNTLFGKCTRKLGVTHGDELTSLFKLNAINPRELNSMDTAVSKLMVDIWTKFATSEIPTVDGTENGFPWPAFNSDAQKREILHIDSERPSIMENPFEEKYKFWNDLPMLSNLNKIMFENVLAFEHHNNFAKEEL
ncbi:Hypothetical protein CINCED_3A016801 [Cinara cedri]|uniref:Carboxylic ester hydrolase n=1 Tax=Cinara cedri TaxID=506608 RepID=A0A5E4N9Y9_9HEMI|nr:Hypothetical protein CINCED_3A016801 [Cinara cedri]